MMGSGGWGGTRRCRKIDGTNKGQDGLASTIVPARDIAPPVGGTRVFSSLISPRTAQAAAAVVFVQRSHLPVQYTPPHSPFPSPYKAPTEHDHRTSTSAFLTPLKPKPEDKGDRERSLIHTPADGLENELLLTRYRDLGDLGKIAVANCGLGMHGCTAFAFTVNLGRDEQEAAKASGKPAA